VTEVLAIGLGIYLGIGMLWAGGLLSLIGRKMPPPKDRGERIAHWIANVTLFCRWTANWLPTLLHYWFKAER